MKYPDTALLGEFEHSLLHDINVISRLVLEKYDLAPVILLFSEIRKKVGYLSMAPMLQEWGHLKKGYFLFELILRKAPEYLAVLLEGYPSKNTPRLALDGVSPHLIGVYAQLSKSVSF